MNLLKYKSSTLARVVSFFMFLLCISSGVYGQENDGWGDDGWGTPDTTAVTKKVYTLDDYIKIERDGESVYTIFVKNISDEVMVLRQTRLKSIKVGDVKIDMKAVKVNILEQGTIRVLPGEQRNLITITAKQELEDPKFNWGYTYNTSFVSEPVPGKPTEGIDYVTYTDIDSTSKHVIYYIHNFSDKPLTLKSVQEMEENEFNFNWERSSVMTGMGPKFYKYKTKYRGPKKPATLAPGKSIMIWKESYMDFRYYPFISLDVDIEFSSATKPAAK